MSYCRPKPILFHLCIIYFLEVLTFFEVQRAVVISDLVSGGLKQGLYLSEKRLGGHVRQTHVPGTGGTKVQRLRWRRDATVRAAIASHVRIIAEV